jgi:hypothetical protein
MLCFEVWKNDEKLTVAGVRESGVISFLLNWVGKGPGASALAAAADGLFPGWIGGSAESIHPIQPETRMSNGLRAPTCGLAMRSGSG